MKRVSVIAAAILLSTQVAAQQPKPTVEYLISPRVFALAGAGSDEAPIMGSEVMLRTAAGKQASATLVNREGNGVQLLVVPSDLGAGGMVALRVELSLIRAGQSRTAKFDLLSGPQAQRPTVAIRDGSGGFIRDEFGRPIYATFDVVTRERR